MEDKVNECRRMSPMMSAILTRIIIVDAIINAGLIVALVVTR